jgi:hypothetical protein
MLKLKDAEDPAAAKKEINKILYGSASYKLHKPTSYGYALSGLPDKPEVPDIAVAVSEMNEEASQRAKAAPGTKRPPSESEGTEPAKKKAPPKEDTTKTRMNFLREMGDQQVTNPNPESKHRFPRIKIRSLPWTYQKVYYEKWRGSKQAAQRVVERYLEAAMAAEAKGWLGLWMKKLAGEIQHGLHLEDYEISVEPGEGPLVYVTIKGASEDGTTARKASHEIGKIMEASIKHHSEGVPGFKQRVKSFNRGADLVLECEILFP